MALSTINKVLVTVIVLVWTTDVILETSAGKHYMHCYGNVGGVCPGSLDVRRSCACFLNKEGPCLCTFVNNAMLDEICKAKFGSTCSKNSAGCECIFTMKWREGVLRVERAV